MGWPNLSDILKVGSGFLAVVSAVDCCWLLLGAQWEDFWVFLHFSFFIFISKFSYFSGVFMITFRQVSITTPSPPPPPPPGPPPPPTPPTPGVGFSSVAQGGGKETIEIFISPGFFFFFPFLLLLFHLLLLLLLLFLYYDYYYYYFYSSFVGGGLQRGSTWRPVGLSRDKSSETNQQMKNKREREMDREKKIKIKIDRTSRNRKSAVKFKLR